MVEATDELRERLLRGLVEAGRGRMTDVEWAVCSYSDADVRRADALLPLVAAVVAEARTEGAIAELEAATEDIFPGEGKAWLRERAAAIREGGKQLPTKPGLYAAARNARWELDAGGQWWFRGYTDRPHPTPDQQDRTELDVRTYGMPLELVEGGNHNAEPEGSD